MFIKKIALIMLILFLPLSLAAVELQVIVIDFDLQLPVEGALVQIGATEARTNADGKVTLNLPDNQTRPVVTVSYPGYENSRQLVRDLSQPHTVRLTLAGIIEGRDLEIVAEAIGATDAAVGASLVVEKAQIINTAKIGVVEDAITAVKILPGVAYDGVFGSNLAVRGAYPDNMSYMMDGFIVSRSHHWGSTYSIFNPNIVESLKFSSGIFSVRYGLAGSGILDVNTVEPNEGLKINLVQSTTTSELFLQAPLDSQNKSGLLLGGRATYFDLLIPFISDWLKESLGQEYDRIPYLYDFYLKGYFNPTPAFNFYLNGFIGSDGIGVTVINPEEDPDKEITEKLDMNWSNLDMFANAGFSWLVNDLLLFKFSAGYEQLSRTMDAKFYSRGTQSYSDEFLNNYSTLMSRYGLPELGGAESFSLDILANDIYQKHSFESLQSRADLDFNINNNVLLSTGGGVIYDQNSTDIESSGYLLAFQNNLPVYQPFTSDVPDTLKNNILNSFFYMNSELGLLDGALELEAGVRFDHTYLWWGNSLSLNTYPSVQPRASITWHSETGNSFFKKNSFTIGAGLFNQMSRDLITTITEDVKLDDFFILPDKTLTALIGWESRLPLDSMLRLEGYYKYFFDRFYFNVSNDQTVSQDSYKLHNDGIGHAFGFDFMLERKISRYIDGMINYSYSWVKYYSPEGDDIEFPTENFRGVWYFPNFHRYHTVNLLLNVRPTASITLTGKLTFASGAPLLEYGDKQMFGALLQNRDGSSQVVEMYNRRSYFNDNKRGPISLPLDLKFAYHNFFNASKVKWSFYIGIQNALSPLLNAVNQSDEVNVNRFTGEESPSSVNTLSFPIPSIGFEISY